MIMSVIGPRETHNYTVNLTSECRAQPYPPPKKTLREKSGNEGKRRGIWCSIVRAVAQYCLRIV